MTKRSARTVILGIGNPLMTDDGVGVQFVREVIANPEKLPGVHCLDGGTLGFLLVSHIDKSDDLIVVDAARMRDRPGSVWVFENEAMDTFLGCHPERSVHEVGLADLMGMLALSNHLPERRALIAVQPENTDWGTKLSAPVEESLPVVGQQIRTLMEQWSA